MSAVRVVPMRTAKQRMEFIKFPWRIYEDDSHWVAPLLADQKEFLDPNRGVFFDEGEAELLMAYRGKEPVARVSAQINYRHQKLYGDGKGFFGFFEGYDDQEATQVLLGRAEEFLRKKGCTSVEGPFSFSIYDEIAVLVDGFDSDPYILNLHNPPYYDRLMATAGYQKAVDWYAFRARRGTIDAQLTPTLKKISNRVLRNSKVTIRTMDPAHFVRDSSIVKDIFNDAWSANWGHVPMSDAQFSRIGEALKQLIIPELSLVAEVDGKPAGFVLSVWDANHAVKKVNGRLFPFGFISLMRNMKKTDRFRLMLLGVLESHRGRGLEFAMILQVIEKGLEMGFNEAEMSLIVEDNEPMLKALERLAVERYKTYRIYRKDL